jgi:hypothetical protein
MGKGRSGLMAKQEAVYQTTDFYLACYLKCIGYDLVGIASQEKRLVFKFEDQPMRREAILAFYNNNGSVTPLALISAIRDLKALMYNLG